MYHNSYEKIDITDFEKLCLLADDVFDQIRYNSYRYENNGDSISDLYFQIENEDEAREEVRRRVDAEIEKETATQTIDLIDMILNENYTLRDAIDTTAAELKERIRPLSGKIVGIFKKPEWRNTPYYVDESVDEELLLEIFAMRLRDRMIVFGAQRKNSCYMLILRHKNGSIDCVGAYSSVRDVRKAYKEAYESYIKTAEGAVIEIHIFSKREDTMFCAHKQETPEEFGIIIKED